MSQTIPLGRNNTFCIIVISVAILGLGVCAFAMPRPYNFGFCLAVAFAVAILRSLDHRGHYSDFCWECPVIAAGIVCILCEATVTHVERMEIFYCAAAGAGIYVLVTGFVKLARDFLSTLDEHR